MRTDDWLLDQLPVAMGDDVFFCQFLKIFQSVADTVLDQVDSLPAVFDATVAPTNMVRQLGQWIGIDWLDSSYEPELQRRIVVEYARLLPARGTRLGLIGLLNLISGDRSASVTDSGGVYIESTSPSRDPHIDMSIDASPWTHPDDVVRIIRSELPVNATFVLTIGGVQAWPRPTTTSGAATGDGQAWPPPHDTSTESGNS